MLLPAACLGVLLLAGCERVGQFYDSNLNLDNPVDWWHQLEGGLIADERPPPPGLADPYPNLARVPPKPTPTDPATRRGLLAQLSAQRDRTRQLVAQDPVVWPPPNFAQPPGAPGPVVATQPGATKPATKQPVVATPGTAAKPGAPAAPANDSDSSKMVLEAASAGPTPTQSAPAPAQTDPHPPAAFTTPPRASEAVVSGPIPAMPGAAPALPTLPGLALAVPEPVETRAVPATQFSFAPGSAALPAPAETGLRALAAQRTTAPIAVLAGGDGASMVPEAQRAALPLAVRRTGAIVAVLVAAGVPSTAIRSEAVAAGRGGSARLVE